MLIVLLTTDFEQQSLRIKHFVSYGFDILGNATDVKIAFVEHNIGSLKVNVITLSFATWIAFSTFFRPRSKATLVLFCCWRRKCSMSSSIKSRRSV